MKWYSRRAAAVVLALALFVPSIAAAPWQPRERDWTALMLRIIEKVKHGFGISANSDHVTPPTPAPTPPPTTT